MKGGNGPPWRVVVVATALLYLAGSAILAVVVWLRTADPGLVAAVVTVLLAIPTAGSLTMGLVGWARKPGRPIAGPADVEEAARILAGLVAEQWNAEAKLRLLDDPDPMPVQWRPPGSGATTGLLDHPENVYGAQAQPLAGSGDQIAALTERFRALRRRRLVILGGAGTGKTTLALQLVRSLLAGRCDGEPVPVLLSVAGWDTGAYPDLHDWLAAKLDRDYPALRATRLGSAAPRTLAARGYILPVLDGLDELPADARSAFVGALNRSLGDGDQLIVTSRTDEYAGAVDQAGDVLNSAAGILPRLLTPTEAADYLRRCLPPRPGPVWEQVLDRLRTAAPSTTDEVLAQAVSTPLGLWLLRTVYIESDADPDELLEPGFATAEELRAYLFDNLVPALVDARPPSADPAEPFRPRRHHDPERVRAWLGFLAHHMNRMPSGEGTAGTRDFVWWHLARHTLRPRALPVLAWIAGTLAAGLIPLMLSWPPDNAEWVWVGPFNALLFAVTVGIWIWLSGSAGHPTRRFRPLQLIALPAGLGGFVVGNVIIPFAGFPVGLGIGLGLWHRFGAGNPVARWSHEDPGYIQLAKSGGMGHLIRRVGRNILGLGLVSGLLAGLAAAYMLAGFAGAMGADGPELLGVLLSVWLAVGLAVALPVGLLAGLVSWAQTPTPEGRADTPMASWRADRALNLIRMAGVGLLAGAAFGFWQARVNGLERGLVNGLAFGLLAGFLGTFFGRHHAWLAYRVANRNLARKRRVPHRLMPFLDDAHRLGLVRAVGPVYQFRHAALQDHLAATYEAPPARRRSRVVLAGAAAVIVAVITVGALIWSSPEESEVTTIETPGVDETAGGNETDGLAILTGHRGRVSSVVFSPDGGMLASSGDDSTVRLWDTASGDPVATLSGHDARPVSVAFSPDGATLASASGDGTIVLWDVDSAEPSTRLAGQNDSLWSVAFSPDGTTLASTSRPETLQVWDVESGEPLTVMTGDGGGPFWSVAFSPDGDTLASAGNTGVRLWDTVSGDPVATLTGHDKRVWTAVYSPDGTTVATASDDATVRLWHAESAELSTTLTHHDDRVFSVAFSPDGTMLASAGADQKIVLWDVDSAASLTTLTGHDAGVWSLAFSPDGDTLASAGEDGTVRLWMVP